MALARAAGLCRLALRTHWAAVRLLGSTAAGGELPGGEDKRRSLDLEALPGDRALRPPPVRPRYVPSRKVYRTPKPTPEQLQLNKSIQACASVDEVLDLVMAQPALLNGVIVPTALTNIARLVGKREPARWLKSDARFRQLMRSALPFMEGKGVDAQGFSNTLYACGQLSIAPPPSWLRVYWDCSARVLEDFVSQALSNTMYACGQLGIAPPADWLQRYWQASALKMDEFIPQDYSNTLYACGQLGITPPADWMQRYWHATALKLGEFNPQTLSNTLYASGQLGITPPDDWMQRFWHACALKFGESVPQDFSNTIYACGQLGVTPPEDWLSCFWHASASKLGEFIPQALSNTLYAFGQLGISPPTEWLQRFWAASSLKLCEFNAQALSNTLFACAQLHTSMPADLLRQYSSMCERLLPDMNKQDLVNTALALAMLGLWELPVWRSLWECLCLATSLSGTQTTIFMRGSCTRCTRRPQLSGPGCCPRLAPSCSPPPARAGSTGQSTRPASCMRTSPLA